MLNGMYIKGSYALLTQQDYVEGIVFVVYELIDHKPPCTTCNESLRVFDWNGFFLKD